MLPFKAFAQHSEFISLKYWTSDIVGSVGPDWVNMLWGDWNWKIVMYSLQS